MKHLFWIIALSITLASSWAYGQTNFFDNVQTFMQKNVEKGLVDYQGIANDSQELNQLVESIANYDLSTLNADGQLAFYLNAYNILTIKSVIDNAPINSPLDVEGFFNAAQHQVAGTNVTLDAIENSIIRPTYNDSRIHFALVCGALDCPPLTQEAFTPVNVKKRLSTLTQKALNNPLFIKSERGGKIFVSKIFDWYKVDFGGDKEGIATFLNKYRNTSISADQIEFYEYNWELNAQ